MGSNVVNDNTFETMLFDPGETSNCQFSSMRIRDVQKKRSCDAFWTVAMSVLVNCVIIGIFSYFIFKMKVVQNRANDISTAANDTPCGDWEPYKGEHCYKVLDKAGLQSFGDAEKTCQQNGATLISIHFSEEQDFLTNYIFKKNKAVDNVWIGARYAGSKFQWQDKSDLTFTNWASGSPRNLADYCVQMQSDVDSVGKWIDGSCLRKNLVVCQKRPPWSMKLFEKMVIELTNGLQKVNQKLTETQTKLTETEKNLVETKQKLEVKLNVTQTELTATKVNLEEVIDNPVPIGFTYVQLPKDKSPKDIWPSMSWTDVSSDYAGVFFRVEGGDAAAFGQIQADNAPRMETTITGDISHIPSLKEDYNINVSMPKTGWSYGIPTGGISGTTIYTSFKFSDIAEVRPKNMAMRVWKRTA